ncbi:MAG: hypothetical protein JST58_19325 [Bacteroidetes bacterium]|nr:hypothetical protein [Bacteroidota bacterium]
MRRKILRFLLVAYLLFLTSMLSAWTVFHILTGGKRINPKYNNSILAFAAFPTNVFNYLKGINNPSNDERWVSNSSAKDGFEYFTDSSQISPGYLLVSSFNEKNYDPNIKLINIRTGQLLKTWELNVDTALRYDPAKTKLNFRAFHPLLFSDKSIVYNTEYGLVKIDSNSKILWARKGMFHHSIEIENDSVLWVPSRNTHSKLYHFNEYNFLYDDELCSVDARTGKTLFEKSVAQILMDNGYGYVLNCGYFENDLIHLNEIQPALTNSRYWQKGDLLVSFRNKSTVFLYRPSTNKILWLKQGPWIEQHHCSFIDTSKIMIFGNDALRFGPFSDTLLYGHNNAYVYDFSTNKTTTPFEKLFVNERIATRTEGRCNLLENGDIFVAETNYGRVIIGDSTKAKLIYTQRINGNYIKMFNLVRYLKTIPF